MRQSRRWQLLLALATAAATITLTASPAAAKPGPSQPWPAESKAGLSVQSISRIWNYHTKNCLLVQGAADGAAVTQSSTCTIAPSVDQNWYLSSTGDGYYYIVNNNSRKCLLARAVDNKAVQWACGNYGDQHWSVIVDTSGYYSMLKNRTSGKCLVVRVADTQASTYDCHSEYADQWWYRA